MPLPSRPARFTAVATATAITALLVFGATPAATANPAPTPQGPSAAPGRYIVTLAQKPLATYSGGIKGLAATKATRGERLDTTSAAAKRYQAYLLKQQTEAASRVGARTVRQYSVGLNGFIAQLTPRQAQTLARTKGVLAVSKDVRRQLTDDRNSVDFLKLSGSTGLWSSLGGTAKAGQGVVVGVLDTGYWPQSKSFAGRPLGTAKPTAADPFRPYRSGGKIIMKKADGSDFIGTCQGGEAFSARLCNTKVVGARYFADGFEANNGPIGTADYRSPRDGEGHGTHTASTAAGNADVEATVDGHSFGKISGVAPGAKLAIYKVGFTADNGSEGIYNSDAIAAIDAAIVDGVDVINFSVSSSDTLLDPVDLEFLSAASAGIFVSASAGNSGPGASTVDHTSPWLTTVAASTVKRYESTLKLGNGKAYAGVSTTVFGTVGPARLVSSTAVKTNTAAPADANLCIDKTLDPGKTKGKIIVCQRGGNPRVAKSDEVKRAGGVGMVLLNPVAQDLEGDSHVVPTIHLNPPDATAVRAYVATAGATATMLQANTTGKVAAYPQISPFSSRGPSVGNGGDLLKPDIAAPGVDTLAALSPPTNNGHRFGFLSGTSMAAPHVAGVAALYFGVHPNWSAMAVKSALMTTAAKLVKADGKVNNNRFDQGAGNVRPDRMLNPGVIFDSADQDWLEYLQGQGVNVQLPGVDSVDPSDYNSPSIAIGKLVDSQTVTRRVTAVSAGLYRITTSVPGIRVAVSPSILIFTQPGQTKTIRVKFTRTTAPTGTAAFGTISLDGAGTTARVPVAVTPVVVDAPDTVSGRGAVGSITYPITPGVSGAFPLQKFGLAKGNPHVGEVAANKPNASVLYNVVVPAGAKVAKFALASVDTRADIDLVIYRVVDGELIPVAASGGSTGVEDVVLTDPVPGAYVAEVTPFSDPPGLTKTAFVFTDFVVTPATNLGNLTVTPTNPTAVSGQVIPVRVSWSGIDASTPYLGLVQYPDQSYTFVQVN